MIKNISQLLNSGFCRRWHSNPDMVDRADDLAQHQWNVAMIVMYLEPNFTKRLLVEALTHDVGELVVGDLAYDFKINNPEIARLHKEGEEKARELIISSDRLTAHETSVLKLADWLSSYWWVAKNNPNLLDREDWIEQTQFFYKESKDKPFAFRAKELIYMVSRVAGEGYTDKIKLGWIFKGVIRI